MEKRKLTIGMLAIDDFDGIYHTIQTIRLYHPEVLDEIEIIVVDNNPTGHHALMTQDFMKKCLLEVASRYVSFSYRVGSLLKEKIYQYADTPYILCVDPGVSFVSGSLRKLIDFFERGEDNGNIIQGPMIESSLNDCWTHLTEEWNGISYGKFAMDDRLLNPDAKPFEISHMTLSAFACRKDSWINFPQTFYANSSKAEDFYIHKKAKQMGKVTMCLPFFKWIGKTKKTSGTNFSNTLDVVLENYITAHLYLKIDTKDLKNAFKHLYTEEKFNELESKTKNRIENFESKIK